MLKNAKEMKQNTASVKKCYNTDLVDCSRVQSAHGKLIGQSHRVSIKVFAAVKDKSPTSFQSGRLKDFNFCTDSHQRSSRHQLGVIVLCSRQKVGLAPHQEVIQSIVRVSQHVDVISVGPDLQAHQHDADVHRTVQLRGRRPEAQEQIRNKTFRSTNIEKRLYLVDVIHHAKNARPGVFSVPFVLEEKRKALQISPPNNKPAFKLR